MNAIEGKLPDSRKATPSYKPDKNDLLLFDYEEYREAVAAYVMASYIGKPGAIEKAEKKVNSLSESLEPISKLSQFNLEKNQKLLAVKIVDWMEENNFTAEINEERWKSLFNELESQA